MQIDILPVPNISGKDDAEKLNNLISYVTQLHNILRVILTSLDTDNLTADLASKIENSIKVNPDLSEYATRRQITDIDSKVNGANALIQELDKEKASKNELNEAKGDLSRQISNVSSGLQSDISEVAEDLRDHNHGGVYQPAGDYLENEELETTEILKEWGFATKQFVRDEISKISS